MARKDGDIYGVYRCFHGFCSAGRYLLCEINVPDRSRLLLLDERAIIATVRAAVARTHGDYGAAVLSLRFSGKHRWKKFEDASPMYAR